VTSSIEFAVVNELGTHVHPDRGRTWDRFGLADFPSRPSIHGSSEWPSVAEMGSHALTHDAGNSWRAAERVDGRIFLG